MTEATKIEWADSTWSPWQGCTKISPGCDHCYAEARDQRFHGGEHWGPGAPRRRTADWTKPRLWNRQAAAAGVRRSVFPSLCDPFDNEVDPAWRADLFELIAATPNLDWLLLTKRIGNAHAMIRDALDELWKRADFATLQPADFWPWPNVWIGATVVDQEEADRDVPKLLATPAAVRFLSIEPMLGAVDLTRGVLRPHRGTNARLDWVIAGGESGRGARPAQRDWFRSLRDQCAAAGVPFLFKQWGEWAPGSNWPFDVAIPSGTHDCVEAHDNDRMWLVGKKAAGRLLDGVEHNAFPNLKGER